MRSGFFYFCLFSYLTPNPLSTKVGSPILREGNKNYEALSISWGGLGGVNDYLSASITSHSTAPSSLLISLSGFGAG